MKKLLCVLSIALLAGSYSAHAQKVKLLDGSLDALKSEEKLNLEYDYSDMGVGKFESEADYLAKKKADYDKKEPGRGDQWESSWKADRKNRFQPQFEELFSKHSGMTAGNIPSAKYTLIFKTTYTEPGYNVYVTRKNAEIDGEALLVETANKSKVIARMSVLNCPGRTFGGNDYDTGERIQEAYAVAGKGLGKFFKDKTK
ncbi:MAG: hypothetical protein H3C54_01130 [Taibaiella sp.]|nr:hypothetical protein [Taibaiella sp.]